MPGTLVLSFDTELGWGSIENGLWRRREAAGVFGRTRGMLSTLLDRMDDLEIPATFAVVGGLLVRPDDLDLGHLPLPATRATERALEQATREDTFYGPDVIEAIAGARVRHEIGCHTYSHTRFTYPGVDEESVRGDLSLFARTLPEGLGTARSLVFPRNEERFEDELKKAGFRAYRGGIPASKGTRARRLVSSVLRPPSLSGISEVRPGLLRTGSSLFFNPGYHRRYALPLVLAQASRGLGLAARTGGTLHVYNHPFNFAEVPGLLGAYTTFLGRAARLREAGLLSTKTMAELC